MVGVCVAGGYAWLGGQGVCSRSVCMVGRVCVTGRGMPGRGACVVGGRGHAWQEKRPLQRVVYIPLECILVFMQFSAKILPNKRLAPPSG